MERLVSVRGGMTICKGSLDLLAFNGTHVWRFLTKLTQFLIECLRFIGSQKRWFFFQVSEFSFKMVFRAEKNFEKEILKEMQRLVHLNR